MAIVLAIMIAWLHPLSTIRLMVCILFLFLVAAIAVGPERARDGSFFFLRRFLRLWKVELTLSNKLFSSIRHRFQDANSQR
ncbi:hypothetical protein [uncultured Shimia sp.]|uniref:hypothetical protein n=1 Tax=uncultured Shimia sp. TaxID=573152 RepID=UPI00262B4D90|nr:hypothetical protein [uncultured Shimia sp.]